MDKIVTVSLPMAERTQTQFDSSAELKRQIKLLMVYENINSQAVLFLSALDAMYGGKYPDLHKAIMEEFKPKGLAQIVGEILKNQYPKPEGLAGVLYELENKKKQKDND